MEESFSQILKKYQKDWSYKNNQMSLVLGISERMYAYYEKGDYDGNQKKVNSYLQKLANHENDRKDPNFNFDSLTLVIPNASDIIKVKGKSIRKNYDSADLIPYYNVDFVAGNSIEFIDDDTVHPEYYMDIPEFKGCIAFRSYSDSMEKLIRSGSILFGNRLVEWNEHLEYGQVYGIVMKDKRRYLKYIRKHPDNNKEFFLLESENKEKYDDFDIPKNKIKSIWLIEGWLNKNT